jgi:protein-tyrosine phosphatase
MAVEAGPRLERVPNFRDVGGVETLDGRRLKTGLLYRSSDLSKMSRRDVQTLRMLGIQLVCDLRSRSESRRKRPRGLPATQLRWTNIPLQGKGYRIGRDVQPLRFVFEKSGGDEFRAFCSRLYRHLAFERAKHVGEVLRLLAQAENLPAVIHCRAGKDRTGFIAALVQLLAGVPYDRVRDHYLLTNDYFAAQISRWTRLLRLLTLFRVPAERLRLLLTARADFLDEVYAAILEHYGSIESYVYTACGLDAESVRNLRILLIA